MKIFDGFIFCEEWEMLKLRCEELKGLDVTHILVESPWTHSGLPKPLHFQERKEEFKQYNIKHVIATDIIVPGKNARYAETLQRNAIAWELVGCSDEDVIIISDVDEVPRKTEVEKYRSEMGLAALSMNNHYYWLNCVTEPDSWRMPKIMNYGFLKHNTPDQVRDMGYPTTLHNAGWHWSWLGGVEKVMEKFKNFSHQEESVQKHANPEVLKKKIETGQSMWGDDYWHVVPIDSSYPEYLQHNQIEFLHLIKEVDMKPKSLGGVLFIYNGRSMDYNFMETAQCLIDLCDQVVLLDAGSTDGTAEELDKFKDIPKVTVVKVDNSEWKKQQGKEKLSYFTNLAKSFLTTEYYINIQGDEILADQSYPFVRKAIETGYEAFVVKRINLWKDCNHMLNVPQDRKPCSTKVIRIAKTNYNSVDDAESIGAPAVNIFVNEIILIHYGFVREAKAMVEKVNHMITKVFLMSPDPKMEGMKEWDSTKWFVDEDLLPLDIPHPKLMTEWVKTRPRS
jgi:beta-1,4-mannosyl-glycoprotein beta-1,4-N-acetylglucosaminyltransferase